MVICFLLHFPNTGKPPMHYFPFEKPLESSSRGTIVPHDDFRIMLEGRGARLVSGKQGQALTFPGSGQYAQLGQHRDKCFGNLDLCPNGALFATYFRPGKYRSSQKLHYIHTGDNGIDLWYEDNKLRCTFKTTDKIWTLDYEGLEPDVWYLIEYSWHPDKGLSLWLNDEKVKTVRTSTNRRSRDVNTGRSANIVYFGRGVSRTSQTANMTLDEMEYWYADRDYLMETGWINRGIVLFSRWHYTPISCLSPSHRPVIKITKAT